jgi:hydrogenase expression/formation protein HypE
MSEDRLLLAHGDGGQLMAELIIRVFVSHLGTGDPPGDDSALLPPVAPGSRLVFTTDAFVVDPLFFPGGDIGKLAVCGTVNDLASAGARPLALSASFILEEGLLIADLEQIVASMAVAAQEAGVKVICGDTKVVPHGKADGIFISTSGVGEVRAGLNVSGVNAQPGDAVLVSGTLADHGLAVLSQREGLEFASPIISDCAPLAGLVTTLLQAVPQVHVLRDPTRGGLATTLNEIAAQSAVEIVLDEAAIPVNLSTAAACELLGLDPLYIANEGKMIVIVPEQSAETALTTLRCHPLGKEAALIGQVTAGTVGRVLLRTTLGTHRLLDRHVGEQLPRIC